MNAKYLIDEIILVALLKSDASKEVEQTLFRHYKKSFIHFFKKNTAFELKAMAALYQEAMASLIQEIKNQPIPSSLNRTLFNLLVDAASKLQSIDGYKTSRNNRKTAPFLAGEVLIQLIQRGHETSFATIFKYYKQPTIAILSYNYGHYFRAAPIEIYGESLMILKNNILSNKVKLPLTSRLFTYFFLIARNKFLNLGNHLKGLTFCQDLEGLERKTGPAIASNNYFDYLNHARPVLSAWFENKEDVFVELLSTFNVSDREMLNLRFNEGLRFKEIGNRLNIKEATCRKRLHDCLKKWKTSFHKNRQLSISE